MESTIVVKEKVKNPLELIFKKSFTEKSTLKLAKREYLKVKRKFDPAFTKRNDKGMKTTLFSDLAKLLEMTVAVQLSAK